MAQYIQKYNKGNKLDGLKAQFNSAYQTASAEDKAKVEGYLQSALNYASVDRMNNRSQRQFEELVYSNALGMLNGTFQNVPSAGVSTKNIFNGYNRRENTQNADQLAYNYLNQNKKSSTASNNSSSNSNSSTGGSYKYVWNHGWSSDWATEGEALEDRLAAFTDMLTTNMSDLLKHKQKGDKIFGFNGSSEEADIQSTLNALLLIKSGIGTEDSKQLLKKLANAARRAGADAQSFKDYFGEYMILTQGEKNLNNLKRLGWSVTDDPGSNAALSKYLTDNNYNILTDKSGNTYLFDADYNQIKGKGFVEANTNWTDEGQYGQGYGVDDNGRLWYGNTDDIAGDHFLSSIYNNYLENTTEKNDVLFGTSAIPWNEMTSFSDKKLLNDATVRAAINNKKFIDVGQLFKGDAQVIAVPTDGKTINKDKFGNIKLDKDVVFYYQAPDGTIKSANSYNEVALALGGFNVQGYNEKDLELTNFEDLYKGIVNATRDDNLTMTANYGGGWFNWDDIKDNPTGWLDEVFKILKSGKSKNDEVDLEEFGLYTNPGGLIGLITEVIQKSGYNMTPEQLQLYREFVRKNQKNIKTPTTIVSERRGGILYAKEGVTIGLDGLPVTGQSVEEIWSEREEADKQALIQRANASGRKVSQQEAGERVVGTDLTGVDIARFGAMAQDVAGLVMSLTGLNAGSAGLGVTSMLTNMGADIFDDSVSKGQVLKNALMNAGFAAVSWVPGANSIKLVRTIAKYVPKIIALGSAGSLALDPNVRNSLSKITSNLSLTVDDWKNIGYVLSAVAGLGRMGRAKYDSVKAKNKYVVKGENHSVTTADGSKATITSGDKAKIDTLLKQGKVDEAKVKLAEITGKSEADFDDSIFKVKGEGIRGKLLRAGLETEKSDKLDYKAMADALKRDQQKVSDMYNGNMWQRFQVNMANRFGGGAYGNEANAIRGIAADNGFIIPGMSFGRNRGAVDIDDLRQLLISAHNSTVRGAAATASSTGPATGTSTGTGTLTPAGSATPSTPSTKTTSAVTSSTGPATGTSTGTGTLTPAGSATPSTPSTGTTSAVTSARKAIMNKKLNAFSDKEVMQAVIDLKKAGALQRRDGKPVSSALMVGFIKYIRNAHPDKSLGQILNNRALKGSVKSGYKNLLLSKGYSSKEANNVMQMLLRKGGQLPNYTMFFNV